MWAALFYLLFRFWVYNSLSSNQNDRQTDRHRWKFVNYIIFLWDSIWCSIFLFKIRLFIGWKNFYRKFSMGDKRRMRKLSVIHDCYPNENKKPVIWNSIKWFKLPSIARATNQRTLWFACNLVLFISPSHTSDLRTKVTNSIMYQHETECQAMHTFAECVYYRLEWPNVHILLAICLFTDHHHQKLSMKRIFRFR